jgi:hypothetical protein
MLKNIDSLKCIYIKAAFFLIYIFLNFKKFYLLTVTKRHKFLVYLEAHNILLFGFFFLMTD